MAIIYPQIADASNPPTTMVSAPPAGIMSAPAAGRGPLAEIAADPVAVPSGRPSRREVEAFLDQMSSRGEAEMNYGPGFGSAFNYSGGGIGSQPVQMKDGGLAGEARRVQQQGRYGDTMLVHMNPDEFNMMTALGGLGGLVNNGATINPQTGLPEMFRFQDILPTVVGVAGAAFGLPTWAVALGAGATTAITTGDIGKGMLAGLGSYALGSLFSDIGASGVPDPVSIPSTVEQGAVIPSTYAQTPMNAPVSTSYPENTRFAEFTGSRVSPGSPPSQPDVGGFRPSTPFVPRENFPLPVDPYSSYPENTRFAGFYPNSVNASSGPLVQEGGFRGDFGALTNANSRVAEALRVNPNMQPDAQNALFLKHYKDASFENVPFTNAFDSAATGPSRLQLFGEGISKIGQPGGVSYLDAATKGIGGLASAVGGMGAFDQEPVDYGAYSQMGGRRSYSSEPVEPLNRKVLSQPEGYRPGFDPAFNYFAADGKRGELDMAMGGLLQDTARSAIGQSAQQIASNAMPQMLSMNASMYSPDAAISAGMPTMRMANGGVPEEMAMAGLMGVASDEVRNNLEERMSVPSAVDEPQNVEERIVYDNAMLAMQGLLEGKSAQRAILDFIEVFGYGAYQSLVQSVNAPRKDGGVIKPANGETTVADGAIQGEDVIAGMIVDPKTGKKSANLRVGENEYVEPADSLARRAKAAGLLPTPKNGAMVRRAEEDKLEAAYG